MDELKENNGEGGGKLWVLIDGKIYDLTDFDHPGGEECLKQQSIYYYKDKLEEFEEVGHSPAAVKMMKKYLIGKLKE